MNGGHSTDSPMRTVVALAVGLYVLTGVLFLVGKGISVRSADDLFAKASFPVEDLVFDPTEIPAAKGKKASTIDLDKAVEASPEALTQGGSLYAENCSFCHGDGGHGDGPAGAALEPLPRDLTVPDGWTNGTRLSDLFQTLTDGLPGTSMAAYDTLSAEDRFALAHYVQSLGKFDRQEDTPDSLAALDKKYGLTRGTREPNRVPVSRAVERMAGESQATAPLQLPERWQEGPRAELFDRTIIDARRATDTLLSSDTWRNNLDSFVNLVTGGAPANGFAPSTATLSAGQWELLRETLMDIIETGEPS